MASDPATLLLTGVLPGMLIASALLAYPLVRLLLRLYTRSVARSMASRCEGEAETEPAATSPGVPFRMIAEGLSTEGSRDLLRAPWRALFVYGAAGISFSAVMTLAWLLSTKAPSIPVMKVLYLFWTYAWPVALTLIVVAHSWRDRCAAMFVYFGVYCTIVVIALARNPSLSWQALPQAWLWMNALPTLLIGAYLTRHVRAVGPIILALVMLALTGAQVLFMLFSGQEHAFKTVAMTAFRIGLNAQQVFWGLKLTALLPCVVAGWLLFRGIGHWYQRKWTNDEMIAVDAIWLLFGIVQSAQLVFQGARWFLSGFVAFAVFKAVSLTGFALLRRSSRPAPRTLLLLRVFSLGKRSERLFDLLRTYWLRLGNIALIAGPDLMTATVQPHEFLQFLGRRIAREFVRDRSDLARRVAAIDRNVDPDGRYRVNELFCRADTWRMTMRELAAHSDAVLMDLRSFSAVNQGCLFELKALLDSVDLTHVVIVIDDKTDRQFLEESLKTMWDHMTADSPNRRHAYPAVRLFSLEQHVNTAELRSLLTKLYNPATPPSAVASSAHQAA